MPWLQIKLRTQAKNVDDISETLWQLGAASVTYQDAADEALLEPAPGETPLWQNTIVTGLFDAEADLQLIESQLRIQPLPIADVHTEILEDQNWERAWLEHFKPMQFGQRLWIVPGEMSPPQADAVNVKLDPGLAFGTGTHPTTAMCLQWLDQAQLQDCQVIDYGCGSGILAIAALKLGAAQVVAVDIDTQALLATQENAKRNLVTDRLKCLTPDDLQSGQVDILLANILAGPLVSLAQTFGDHVRENGKLVLSGLLTSQYDTILTAYAPYFDMRTYAIQDEWLCLEGTRLAFTT